MKIFKQHFRIWWQKPRKYAEKLPDRTITFLELFYDLVYVMIIAQLSHTLAGHLNWNGFLKFVFLFFITWITWFNGVNYHDAHGNNDIRTRIFTFLQMFGVAAMAVFAHYAIGEGAIGFALSYAFSLLVITYLWWRTGIHDKAHAVLSVPYTLTHILAVILVVASVFTEEPMRYYLWSISLFLILVLPVLLIVFRRRNKNVIAQLTRSSLVSHSLVERFGLLIIIVLGEVITGVVQGLAHHHHFGFTEAFAAVLGMGLAIGLWWLYFDAISGHLPHKSLLANASWVYLHLPLTVSITTIGATVLHIIEHSEHTLHTNSKQFLVFAIFTTYISIFLIACTIQIPASSKKVYHTSLSTLLLVAFLSLGVLFFQVSTIFLLSILLVLMLAPVITGLKVWTKQRAAHQQAKH